MRRPSVRGAALTAVPLALAAAALAVPAGAGATPATEPAAYPTDAQGRTLIKETGAPYQNAHLPVGKRVDDLLARMTLEEKIGQMTQAERGAVADDPSLVAHLAGSARCCPAVARCRPRTRPPPGSTWSTRSRARRCRPACRSRIIYGVDAVHGHGNVLRRHGLPAQHRPRRHPRPAAGRADRARHGRGDPRHRIRVDLRAVRLRRPRRAVGPHLRELRRGPGAGRRDGDVIDGLQGQRRADLRHNRPGPGHREALSRVTATPSTATRPPLPTYHDRPGHHGDRPPRTFATIDLAPYIASGQAARRAAASCRRSPASTGPRTAWATRSRCTPTRS